ncbi:MAG: PIN domain-containing protein [Pyrinomonadaceae bacterium]|nr:PIN domain-containing protein [Pyrinomonadaceae bacterium]
MNKIFLDTDVTLDFLLKRQPFYTNAQIIFEKITLGEIEGYVIDVTTVNVFYVSRKTLGNVAAKKLVEDLLTLVEICVTNKQNLQDAVSSNFADYEDAVQHACAVAENLDAIATRNVSDYKNSNINSYTPSDFLAQLQSQNP